MYAGLIISRNMSRLQLYCTRTVDFIKYEKTQKNISIRKPSVGKIENLLLLNYITPITKLKKVSSLMITSLFVKKFLVISVLIKMVFRQKISSLVFKLKYFASLFYPE